MRARRRRERLRGLRRALRISKGSWEMRRRASSAQISLEKWVVVVVVVVVVLAAGAVVVAAAGGVIPSLLSLLPFESLVP